MRCAEHGTIQGHLELGLALLLGLAGCFSDPGMVEGSQNDSSNGQVETSEAGTDSSGSSEASGTGSETGTETGTETETGDVPVDTGESGSRKCLWIRHGENVDDDVGSVTTDTWIDEESPMMNNGTDDDLRADGVSGQGLTETAFVRFDVASLPVGTVTDAVLHLSTNEDDGSESSSGSQFSLYLVGEPWVEAEANWFEASAGVPWSVAGCAAGPCRGETELVVFEPTEQAHRYELPFDPEIVQGWRDEPSSNYGVMLATPAANGASFHSSESSNDAMRPVLEVQICP